MNKIVFIGERLFMKYGELEYFKSRLEGRRTGEAVSTRDMTRTGDNRSRGGCRWQW